MQVRVDNYDKMLKALAKGEKMVQKEIATVYCNAPKRKFQISLSLKPFHRVYNKSLNSKC